MDPWLEGTAVWPDFHNSLIAAIRESLSDRLAPRYFVRIEEHTYLLMPDEQKHLGRPDVAIVPTSGETRPTAGTATAVLDAPVDVLDVVVPMPDRVTDWYLEIRATEGRRRLVTVIEVLSPGNKLHARGRRAYLRQRGRIFESSTHLVEIDLMRAGEPMPWVGPVPQADYRILVSRAPARPRAKVHAFPMRTPIPDVPIPLLPPDDDVPLPLNALVHLTYDRARYDLSLDYGHPPVPPLAEADAAWAAGIVGGHAADA